MHKADLINVIIFIFLFKLLHLKIMNVRSKLNFKNINKIIKDAEYDWIS